MLYLDIPYSEKEEAKALGAKWNPKAKKWYIQSSKNNYEKFARWILRNSSNAIIATGSIYLIEGVRECWKCHHLTKVVGLGIGDFYELFSDKPYSPPECDVHTNSNEIHLAWVSNAPQIPPRILQYLYKHYHVKTDYSHTMENLCFTNHCEHCDTIQGNWYVFNEPDSPLCTFNHIDKIIPRMKKLKIYCIPIKDDLLLDWEFSICNYDYAYLQYAQLKNLVLSSNPADIYASYPDLYNI